MDKSIVSISRSARANPTEIIPTEDKLEHLLHLTTALFEKNVNMVVQSKVGQIDNEKLTANPTGSWMRSIEKMASRPKDSDILKAGIETKIHLSEEDSVVFLEAEHFAGMKIEVQPAVQAAKRKVLRTTVEKNLRDMFLNIYEAEEERSQNSSYQLTKYVLTHLVAVGMLVSVPAINVDKWCCSDTFMDATTHRIACCRKFLEPIKMWEWHRAAERAGGDSPSNPHDRGSSTFLQERTTLDSGSNLSNEKGRAGHSYFETQTKKCQRGWSRERNNPVDIDEKRREKQHGSFQSSNDGDIHI